MYLFTKDFKIEGDKVTRLVTLEMVFIMVRGLACKLRVPTIVSAEREDRLLVVRKVPRLELRAKEDPDPVAKLRDTKSV